VRSARRSRGLRDGRSRRHPHVAPQRANAAVHSPAASRTTSGRWTTVAPPRSPAACRRRRRARSSLARDDVEPRLDASRRCAPRASPGRPARPPGRRRSGRRRQPARRRDAVVLDPPAQLEVARPALLARRRRRTTDTEVCGVPATRSNAAAGSSAGSRRSPSTTYTGRRHRSRRASAARARRSSPRPRCRRRASPESARQAASGRSRCRSRGPRIVRAEDSSTTRAANHARHEVVERPAVPVESLAGSASRRRDSRGPRPDPVPHAGRAGRGGPGARQPSGRRAPRTIPASLKRVAPAPPRRARDRDDDVDRSKGFATCASKPAAIARCRSSALRERRDGDRGQPGVARALIVRTLRMRLNPSSSGMARSSPARRPSRPPGRRGSWTDDTGTTSAPNGRAAWSGTPAHRPHPRRPGHGGGRARWCGVRDARSGGAGAASSSGCRSSGRRTVNAAPRRGPSLSASIVPPCSLDQVAGRSPARAETACWRAPIEGSPCSNRSKTCGRTSAAMPIPYPARRAPHALPHGEENRDATPSGVNLIALVRRFLDTCWSRVASPRTGTAPASRWTSTAIRLPSAAPRTSSTTASTMAPTSTRASSTLSFPDSIRVTSSRSLMSRACARALRSTISSACSASAPSTSLRRSRWVQWRTALSGERSSCDSVARNWSLARVAASALACASSASSRTCSASTRRSARGRAPRRARARAPSAPSRHGRWPATPTTCPWSSRMIDGSPRANGWPARAHLEGARRRRSARRVRHARSRGSRRWTDDRRDSRRSRAEEFLRRQPKQRAKAGFTYVNRPLRSVGRSAPRVLGEVAEGGARRCEPHSLHSPERGREPPAAPPARRADPSATSPRTRGS